MAAIVESRHGNVCLNVSGGVVHLFFCFIVVSVVSDSASTQQSKLFTNL